MSAPKATRSRAPARRPLGKASNRYTSAGSTSQTAIRPMLYDTLSSDTVAVVSDPSSADARSRRAKRSPGRRRSAASPTPAGTATTSPWTTVASARSSAGAATSENATVAAQRATAAVASTPMGADRAARPLVMSP